MKGFFGEIGDIVNKNSDYRRVLYTTKNAQLVIMSVGPGQEIGEEVHFVDQFLCIVSGQGKLITDGTARGISDGDAVIVPAKCSHNVINTASDAPLKLYSIYSPPQHVDGTVHKTKADEAEEHFDGETTE